MNSDFLKQLTKDKKSDSSGDGGNATVRKTEEKKEKKYDSTKIFEELDDSKKEAQIKRKLDVDDEEKATQDAELEQIKQGYLKKYENESVKDAYKNLLEEKKKYNDQMTKKSVTMTDVGDKNFLLDLVTSDALIGGPINTNYDDPKFYLNVIPLVHKAGWYDDIDKKAKSTIYKPSELANFLKGEIFYRYIAIGAGTLFMTVSPTLGLFIMLYYFLPKESRTKLKEGISKKLGLPVDKIDNIFTGYDDYMDKAGKELKKKLEKAKKKRKKEDKEVENQYNIAQARYDAALEREKKKEEELEKQEKEKKELLEKYQKNKKEQEEKNNDNTNISSIMNNIDNTEDMKNIFNRLNQNLDNPEYCSKYPELNTENKEDNTSTINNAKVIINNFITGLNDGKKYIDLYNDILANENNKDTFNLVLKLFTDESQRYMAEKKFTKIKDNLAQNENNYKDVESVKNKIDTIIFDLKNGKNIQTILEEIKSDKSIDIEDINKLISDYNNIDIEKNNINEILKKEQENKKEMNKLDEETIRTKNLLTNYFNNKNKEEENEKSQGRY